MAGVSCNDAVPPVPFLSEPGTPVVSWPTWIKMFQNYLTARDASEFSPERKQALLLCCIGTEAQRIYYSIPETTPPTGTDVFSHTLTVLSKQFEPAQKPVIARIKFKQREQLAGESIKSYYRALRELAEPCKYGANESEMIRDQIIHKCNNERLQDRLLFETKDITLDFVLKRMDTNWCCHLVALVVNTQNTSIITIT